MKKRVLKISLISILLIAMISGIVVFNIRFFEQYKDVGKERVKEEKTFENEEKSIPDIPKEPEKTPEAPKNDTPKTITPVKHTMDAFEEKYCISPFKKEGNECIHAITNGQSSVEKITIANTNSQPIDSFESACIRNGGVLENKELGEPFLLNCIITVKITVGNEEKFCSDGFVLENDTCVKYLKSEILTKYTCPNNYVLNGKKCTEK